MAEALRNRRDSDLADDDVETVIQKVIRSQSKKRDYIAKYPDGLTLLAQRAAGLSGCLAHRKQVPDPGDSPAMTEWSLQRTHALTPEQRGVTNSSKALSINSNSTGSSARRRARAKSRSYFSVGDSLSNCSAARLSNDRAAPSAAGSPECL